MSMAVANQMVNTMNTAINKMQVPGQTYAGSTLGAATIAQEPATYIVADNNVAGPFSADELPTLVKRNHLNAQTLVWRPGMNAWKYAHQVAEVNKYILLYSHED